MNQDGWTSGCAAGRTDGFVHDNTGGEVSTLQGDSSSFLGSYLGALVGRRAGDGVPLNFILHGNFLSRLGHDFAHDLRAELSPDFAA